MNIYLKLGVHLVGSLIVRMVMIMTLGGIACLFTAKHMIPIPWMSEEQEKLVIFLVFVFGSILLCFIYCIWYLGKPLVYLMQWIMRLANDVYEQPLARKSFYMKNGKLKKPYQLYESLLLNMEKLTASLKHSAEERERLDELKREWGAGISHDLKTPLTYIKSYSAMLLSSCYSWSELEKTKFMQEIQHKSEHLEELIDDLNLSFRMDHQKIPISAETGDMVDFVRRIAADVASSPRASGHELYCDMNEEKIEAVYDAKLFGRVLYNLLINAVLHNPPGTVISISVRRSDERVRIEIVDNGAGMDEETLRHLFNRYYRGSSTNQKSEGTGLGMAVAKQLVLAHRGEIEVQSKPGEGTAISIAIPA
ncbi:sensor histidine kinase [Paenibacillus sp. UNC451MF]|uniref:sensor histidine kinase n=1 Tax=Paenibacillus sp. UNC451MF TaxID=1449063 RepID=UPI00048D9315|nr:HAMP domain-containing sensor histidine kinase [Paenibacillus sp. UNC451MF]